MKEIISPKFKSKFEFNHQHTSLSEFYFYNQSIFNKLFISICFIILNLIFGIFERFCLIIAISSIFYLVYLYFKVKTTSEKLSIVRKVQNIGREFEFTTIEYTLYNSASFEVDNFFITETFEGNIEKTIQLDTIKSIPKTSFHKFKKKIKLNAGMGVKKFSPLTIYLSDPLDIFQFQIIEKKIDEIKIYPQIEKIHEMTLKGNKYATSFGLFDTPSKGDTTNFIGIKPYRPGDPVKRINWKLSLKTKKTVINEFEKNINATLSIILNLDEKIHMGVGATSTWEYAKDICLAAATQQVNNGNEVQFFSNEIFIPENSGQEHINFLELVVCTLPLFKSQSTSNLVEKSLFEISNESKVLLITSAISNAAFKEDIISIQKCSKFNSNIHVVLIDGTKFMANTMMGSNYLAISSAHAETQKLIKQTISELQLQGIKVSYLEVKSEINYSKHIEKSLTPLGSVNS